MNSLTTTTDLINRYQSYLDTECPDRIKSYHKLLNTQPASAKAEAVSFSFFDTKVDEVRIEETSESGGVDFRCKIDNSDFVVEVTHLEAEAVVRESGVKNEFPTKSSVGSHGWITPLLRKKVSSKASQMSGYNCPRILVITSDHQDAMSLMSSRIAAEFLLTSDTKISIPDPRLDPKPSLGLETSLEESVFFRFQKGTDKLEPCRESISAILLCAIYEYDTRIVGLLHPVPNHEFPIQYLPSIPFVRVKEFPFENNSIHTEWATYKRTKGIASTEQILDNPMAFIYAYPNLN